ncbi:MAG: adenylate/guanylate cyclase domain-containing protein [Anaerolineales bacterium]
MTEKTQATTEQEQQDVQSTEDAPLQEGNWLTRAFSQLRIKITLPYVVLAILVAAAGAYLATRLLAGVLEDRFHTTLVDAGRTANDALVKIEQEYLAIWRSIAYTEGFARAVAAANEGDLGLLAAPHAVNAQVDALEVLDLEGEPLYAMYRDPNGEATDYDFAVGPNRAAWEIVDKVIHGESDAFGDKYADILETQHGRLFYISGPITHEGERVGVLLVGMYLDELIARLDHTALARVSLYLEPGPPLISTLRPDSLAELALDSGSYHWYVQQQAFQTPRREIQIHGRTYAEVFGALEIRHNEKLGLMSVSLPLSFVTDTRQPMQQALVVLFGVATAIIIFIGTLIASAVVQRIDRLAAATEEVARGNLNTQVEIKGRDEVATLANDFNQMVSQLREGRLYRDLLGHTTSPEVAARLREEREKGALELGAQTITAAILFADIRGFTTLSEGREPAYIIQMLNDYFQGIVTVIRQNHGVVNKFIGDAVLAFFGVLPEAQTPEESTRDAVLAALDMLDYIHTVNRQRKAQGELPIRLGIGVNTGEIVAGILGSEERFEYAILGDTVNVTQRISDLNKQFPDYDLFVRAEAWERMAEMGATPSVEATRLSDVRLKGRAEPVDVYAIKGE